MWGWAELWLPSVPPSPSRLGDAAEEKCRAQGIIHVIDYRVEGHLAFGRQR